MATDRHYLDFVLEQLSALEGVSVRPMMGEYVLYYQGTVVGGVYDDRLLLKPAPEALRLLRERGREISMEVPYPGAREMLAADADDAALCRELVKAVAAGLPAGKRKKGKGENA